MPRETQEWKTVPRFQAWKNDEVFGALNSGASVGPTAKWNFFSGRWMCGSIVTEKIRGDWGFKGTYMDVMAESVQREKSRRLRTRLYET